MTCSPPWFQVGACIVSPDDKIVATGYNGMPWGCNDDVMPWLKDSETGKINESKTPYGIIMCNHIN